MTPLRSLPLFDGLGFFARPNGGFDRTVAIDAPHSGLVFDRFVDTWKIDQDGVCGEQKPDKRAGYQGSRREWLDNCVKIYGENKTVTATLLEVAVRRQKEALSFLGGGFIEPRTSWRMTTGLGSGHPYEAGFLWHRTLGVPYLPGASVKGLLRAWSDPIAGWGGLKNAADVQRLFGAADETVGAGALIVFDAIPVQVPNIAVDVLNPHYGEYYQGGKKSTPAADYLDPVPAFFLAVEPGQQFLFSLAPRCAAYCQTAQQVGELQMADDLAAGMKLLGEALATIGAGAKTAVGYGVFSD